MGCFRTFRCAIRGRLWYIRHSNFTVAQRLFHRRTILNPYLSKLKYILILLLLSGCAASTLNTAIQKGATALTPQEIYNLSTGNTLRLISSDFDSHIYFSADGSLSASSVFNNNTDYGTWDITSEAKLCLKFSTWYYGDVQCFSILKESNKDQFLFFTGNGALTYSAEVFSGNSQNIPIKTKNSKKEKYLRKNMSQKEKKQTENFSSTNSTVDSTPVATGTNSNSSRKEVQRTVKIMAQNCPGCNFKNANLRQANLIGANLKGANLRGADLSRANLRRANLEGADLSGATLLNTNLPGANLKGADLTGADFTGSNLIHADFTNADTEGAILKNTLQEGIKGLKQ